MPKVTKTRRPATRTGTPAPTTAPASPVLDKLAGKTDFSREDIMLLQRRLGNHAVQRIMAGERAVLAPPSGFIQRDPGDDIPVAPAGDPVSAMEVLDDDEREADPPADGDRDDVSPTAYWGKAPKSKKKKKKAKAKKYTGISAIVADDVKRVAKASAMYNDRARKTLNNLASASGGELKMAPSRQRIASWKSL
jgi:hypothetical protein